MQFLCTKQQKQTCAGFFSSLCAPTPLSLSIVFFRRHHRCENLILFTILVLLYLPFARIVAVHLTLSQVIRANRANRVLTVGPAVCKLPPSTFLLTLVSIMVCHPLFFPNNLHHMSTKFPARDFIEEAKNTYYSLKTYWHPVGEQTPVLFVLNFYVCHWFMWKEEENYHGQDVWNWVGVWCIVCLGLTVMRFRQHQLWVADTPFIMNRLPEVIVFFSRDGYDTRYAG